jgi:hypothetical protein
MVRRIARLQQLGDLLLGPVADPRRRDIRNVSCAARVLATGKARLWLDGPEQVAGRMTFGAMPYSLGEILAAIP